MLYLLLPRQARLFAPDHHSLFRTASQSNPSKMITDFPSPLPASLILVHGSLHSKQFRVTTPQPSSTLSSPVCSHVVTALP